MALSMQDSLVLSFEQAMEAAYADPTTLYRKGWEPDEEFSGPNMKGFSFRGPDGKPCANSRIEVSDERVLWDLSREREATQKNIQIITRGNATSGHLRMRRSVWDVFQRSMGLGVGILRRSIDSEYDYDGTLTELFYAEQVVGRTPIMYKLDDVMPQLPAQLLNGEMRADFEIPIQYPFPHKSAVQFVRGQRGA